MTHARVEVALIAQSGKESGFFIELVRDLRPAGAAVSSSTQTGTIELRPRCGNGTLVARKGRYGPFYGCFTYPACTFTHDPRRGGL